MWDLPDHLAMPVDERGDGPAEPEDTVRIVCSCGRIGCTEFQEGE
jgi:hypothetical protein